ncbi:hypothetical protein ACQE3E_15550 [Methylomonas sp. MED-D]|uniref:hypothetical protein n=1 Tax=unclassified Methylomonas TaxID=2608980 RepID=UPI003CFC3CE3
MQLNRCPICHARISLDAIVQDEAGRELLGILAKLDGETGFALVGYLGLFRSVSRDLANDRALKLAKDALALADVLRLAPAMRQTVEQIQAKGGKPLTNHNYLKRVLEDSPSPQPSPEGRGIQVAGSVSDQRAGGKPASKTAQALQSLKEFGDG